MRTPEELREAEARDRAVFEALDEALVIAEAVCDDGQRVVDLLFMEVNPAAKNLVGISRWVGHRLSEIEPSFEGSWLESWERVLRTGIAERVEIHVARLERSFECSIVRMGGEASRCGACVFRDVSHRRRTEEARRDAGGAQGLPQQFCAPERHALHRR